MISPQENYSGVAVYWDFENIHAALLDDSQENGSYRKNRFRPQDVLVEVEAVMSYCSSLGTIVVNRAYANWQWMSRYRSDLLDHAIELVQLFSPGSSAKNGADIRLALDALEDVSRYPHITHFVVVGGDSDYISLAQKCRRAGKVVIGVGVQGTVNSYWIKACNEFKYYKTLLGKTGQESDAVRDELKDSSDVEEAKSLLATAMKSLLASASDGRVLSARLKEMMVRLEPSFDEGNYGYQSFGDFLRACEGVVHVHRGKNDIEVELASVATKSAKGEAGESVPEKKLRGKAEDYFKLLHRAGIKPVTPELRIRILKLSAECFRGANGKLSSFQELERQIVERSKASGNGVSETDVRKVKSLLMKFRMFKFHPQRSGISLWMFSDEAQLLRTVEEKMIRHLLNHMDPPADPDKVAYLVYGTKLSEDSAELQKIRQEAEEIGVLTHS